MVQVDVGIQDEPLKSVRCLVTSPRIKAAINSFSSIKSRLRVLMPGQTPIILGSTPS